MIPTAKTTQQDPTITNRLVRLRTALFNVASWHDLDEAVCFCGPEGGPPHTEECEEAAAALGMDCGNPEDDR